MTLMWAPVNASKSGARRWSGSAICGPLNVSRFTLMPLNAWDGAGVAGPAEPAADAAGAEAAVVGAELAAGLEVVVAPLQPAMTRIKPTTGAMDLNRDTGILPLDTPLSSSILNDRR